MAQKIMPNTYEKTLPQGYCQVGGINLIEDKKLYIKMNAGALILGIFTAVILYFMVPVYQAFEQFSWIHFVCMAGFTMAYIVLHEGVHAVAMKYYGCDKVKFGFKAGCAYAGSEGLYRKNPYIVIALAPVILWGVVLQIVMMFLPAPWFWVMGVVQIMNISGAAGDIYVTLRLHKEPENMLIRDTGTAMECYLPK